MNWDPPIDSGLSGVVYPEDALDAYVDDRRGPGVYALRCSLPDTNDHETYHRLWLDHYDVVPGFLEAIVDAGRLLYVGAAKDVLARLNTHLEAPNRSASVCRVFPIHSVVGVWPMDSVGVAFERESGVGIELQNEYPGDYVHYR